jgi:hypothetical protein
MKIKSILAASSLALTAVVSSHAQADEYCNLVINPAVIAAGQSFTFEVSVRPNRIFPGPIDPGLRSGPFNVTFYGTKNGVDDIGPAGWFYAAKQASFGTTVLDGFGNPGGAAAGTYTRYAVLTTAAGSEYCRTNELAAVLNP